MGEGKGEEGDPPHGVVEPCHRQGLAAVRDAWRGGAGGVAAAAAVGAEITVAKGVGLVARTVRRERVRCVTCLPINTAVARGGKWRFGLAGAGAC